MRGQELLEKLEHIAPQYIEEAGASPRVRRTAGTRVLVAAVCACVVAAAVIVPQYLTPDTPAPPIGTSSNPLVDNMVRNPMVSPTYNKATGYPSPSLYIPGYFTEPLTEQELAAVTPKLCPPYASYSGIAGFDGEGKLIKVQLSVPIQGGNSVVISLAKGSVMRDYKLPGEPTVTPCNGVDFALYEVAFSSDDIRLEATAVVKGCAFLFETTATEDTLKAVKKEFELVLTCFTEYDERKPNLDAVIPEKIPEWFDRKLTLGEARNDADFGNYIPSSPRGYVTENARRYKDYRNDYLSVLWCKGLEDVTWRVRRYTEADAACLTSVEDTQNYDMSLYSIPLAETVPEQLLGIVQDPLFEAKDLTLDVVKARLFNGQYTFSVKYGDIVVQVKAAADVGAVWIYEQLTALQK